MAETLWNLRSEAYNTTHTHPYVWSDERDVRVVGSAVGDCRAMPGFRQHECC